MVGVLIFIPWLTKDFLQSNGDFRTRDWLTLGWCYLDSLNGLRSLAGFLVVDGAGGSLGDKVEPG